jgi:hypothetical protein
VPALKWRSPRRGVGVLHAIVVLSSVWFLHSIFRSLWLPVNQLPEKPRKELDWADVSITLRSDPAVLFNNEQMKPSSSLVFHDCYDSYKCARLEVPLDWSSPVKDKRRAAIALAMLPAKVPVTDSRYGGSILINPGKSIRRCGCTR